jgi:hypothetical protein
MMNLIAVYFNPSHVLAAKRPELGEASLQNKSRRRSRWRKPNAQVRIEKAWQEKSNGGASAVFAIRMEYKGEERSTKLPLDEEMIRQLAMEAEFRGMRIGELVAALILGITRKDLFQLVLANAPEQLRVRKVGSTP